MLSVSQSQPASSESPLWDVISAAKAVLLSRAFRGTALKATTDFARIDGYPEDRRTCLRCGRVVPVATVQADNASAFWSVLNENGRPLTRDGRPSVSARSEGHTATVLPGDCRNATSGRLGTTERCRLLPTCVVTRLNRWLVAFVVLFFGAMFAMAARAFWLAPPHLAHSAQRDLCVDGTPRAAADVARGRALSSPGGHALRPLLVPLVVYRGSTRCGSVFNEKA